MNAPPKQRFVAVLAAQGFGCPDLPAVLRCAARLQAAEALRRQHAEEAARLAEQISVLDRSEKRLLTSQALLEAREGELAASVQQLQARWVGGDRLVGPSLLARYSQTRHIWAVLRGPRMPDRSCTQAPVVPGPAPLQQRCVARPARIGLYPPPA